MSRIQWEYDLVERPFCAQLKAMGWQWINGGESGLMTDLLTGRIRVPACAGYRQMQQTVLPSAP
jgi:hypothetical protein